MEIRMCLCMLDGKKGLREERSGCPCALARWKALKAWRGGKHWQGRSQTPKAIWEREREENLPNFFSPSGRLCMWSNRRPGVETLSYSIWNVHSTLLQTSGKLAKGLTSLFFQISVMFYSFAAGIASCITFLFNFGEVYYKMLLYSMWVMHLLWLKAKPAVIIRARNHIIHKGDSVGCDRQLINIT